MILYNSMKMFMKDRRLIAIAGFALFYFIFWYMANDILQGGKEIKDDIPEEKTAEDVHDVDVDLIVGGNTYSAHMTDSQTVADLLDRLRSDNQITYEKLDYTYGTELTQINGAIAAPGYEWNFYEGNQPIPDFTKHNLSDGAVFTLRLDLAGGMQIF